MQGKAIYGQEKAQSDLLNFYRSGHLPHAILMLGKEGSGGLALAISFAQFLLCEQKGDEGEACGYCTACLKTKALVHPDLHFTFPSFPPKPGVKTNSKNFIREFREFFDRHPYGSVTDWLESIGAKDRQSGNISAEECKEMIEALSLKAMEGAYKIQIVWRPEYLGKEGNILLKLIEEPPANTIFLLVAEQTDSVLETILSRTQLVRLQPMADEAIREILHNIYQVPAAEAARAAVLSEGNVAHALAVLQENESDWLQLIKDWFNGVFTYNGNLIGKWVDLVSKLPAVQLKNFLMYAQQLLGHTLRMSLIPGYQPALSAADVQFVQRLSARQFNYQIINQMDSLIGSAVYHVERNANTKVVLLHLSVAMQYALKGAKLSA
ncbi:MAG: DNA polymerase III subunit delta' [Sphingobacteriales bacterium]|nr:MAG: DNA polymerase III subunit delta' [Sphingobacteriales bacterium]